MSQQDMDRLRAAIEDRLSWTPYESVDRARAEVVDVAVGMLAELLWLHAEAVWQREERAVVVERLLSARRASTRRIEETLGEEPGEFGSLELAIDELLEQFAEREASRRDWAAEAMAMDALAERLLTFHGQNEERLSFIARRYLSPGKHRDRFTGVSSDALAWYAIGRRDEPKPGEYPADEQDLAACERTYEMAPEFLRERMLPVLERYRAHVRSLPVCAVHPEVGA